MVASNPLAGTFEEIQCFPLSSTIWKMTSYLGNSLQHSSCLAVLHWNVCWPWYVLWGRLSNRWKAPLRDLSRRVFSEQPTLCCLLTSQMLCQDKHQSACHENDIFCSFTNIWNDWQFCTTHTNRDKPTLWRQLLPRKDDGSRLKSVDTKTISALQKNIG